jgi:RNA polymerase sigma factor (sigma-70 family)
MPTGSGQDEKDLLARATAGDTEAFRILCTRYEGVLYGQIRRGLPPAVRRRVSVLDVLQETWLVAHERLPEFEDRGEGALGAWLARIAELKVREAIRRHAGTAKRAAGREVTRGRRPDTADVPGAGPSPSDLAAASERRAAVRATMAKLPEDYRRVLGLIQGERTTLDGAAAIMGRSREAVKKLYARALARLADLLGLPGKEDGHGR